MKIFKKKVYLDPETCGLSLIEKLLQLDDFKLNDQNEILKEYNDSVKKFTEGLQEITPLNKEEAAAFHEQVREAWGFDSKY